MGRIEIDINRINKVVEIIINKAKDEIPLMPSETAKIEHFNIEEVLYFNEKPFVLSLSCSPPLFEDTYKAMLICCEVTVPALDIDVEIPVLNEKTEDLLKTIESEPIKNKLVNTFIDLIKDVDFNYGHLIFQASCLP